MYMYVFKYIYLCVCLYEEGEKSLYIFSNYQVKNVC